MTARAGATLALAAALSCRGSAKPAPSTASPARDEPARDEPAPVPVPNEPAIVNDWCTSGLAALDEETCYVLPPLDASKPPRLLVYFHGIVPPVRESPQKDNVMSAVLRASTRAGAAAIVPRGVKGVGPAGAKDWWAWPTSPGKHAELAVGIARRVLSAKKALEARARVVFARTYLAGSSNGAYFAATLALRNELDVDGLGAMSGGASSPILRRSPLAVYVGFGTYDETSARGARSLAAGARAAGWPTKLAEHPFGHGAREVYLDEAFEFWDGVRTP